MKNNEQELDETTVETYEDKFCVVGENLASLMVEFWQANPDYAPKEHAYLAYHNILTEFHQAFEHLKEQLLEVDSANEVEDEEDVSEE